MTSDSFKVMLVWSGILAFRVTLELPIKPCEAANPPPAATQNETTEQKKAAEETRAKLEQARTRTKLEQARTDVDSANTKAKNASSKASDRKILAKIVGGRVAKRITEIAIKATNAAKKTEDIRAEVATENDLSIVSDKLKAANSAARIAERAAVEAEDELDEVLGTKPSLAVEVSVGPLFPIAHSELRPTAQPIGSPAALSVAVEPLLSFHLGYSGKNRLALRFPLHFIGFPDRDTATLGSAAVPAIPLGFRYERQSTTKFLWFLGSSSSWMKLIGASVSTLDLFKQDINVGFRAHLGSNCSLGLSGEWTLLSDRSNYVMYTGFSALFAYGK